MGDTISVVIPAYDTEDRISDAIRSVAHAMYMPCNSTSFPEARRLMQRSDLMSGKLTMHEIGGRLKAEFEVTADKAKESEITLMQTLADEDLVQVPDA